MPDNLSKLVSCGHCNNISHMKIIGNVNDTESDVDPEYGPIGEWGTTYSVLECPACNKPNIVSYEWHDGMESEDEITYKTLFPLDKNIPIGLPEKIKKAFQAANKIKTVDVNAYVILLRRLLELVCIDRNAKGKTLALMLKDLADKNEIPEKLVNVAKGLKDFGNIGAHAGIGELSEKEIPIVTALSTAILEYVYSAPYLATLAEDKLKTIKAKK
ncbi:DUF4145 domain-containing protein [Cyclobacterium sediminis]